MSDNAPKILDNRRAKLADYLRDGLKNAETFRLVSAYFSVYGFEALADVLASAAPQTKFLFGAPESAGEIAAGEKPRRRFDLTEDGLSAETDGVLRQSQTAKRCAAWFGDGKVRVREVKGNFLHGKMYHMEHKTGATAAAGSSNFTRRGLGCGGGGNVEINLAVEDRETLDELRQWFDELWNDNELTRDAKQKVLDALKRLYHDYSPEFVYYKTLFELFRKELENYGEDGGQLQDSRLTDSQIWGALYEFQKDGAKHAINRLNRHGGCILADSVGLGKTYTALAVIKHFQRHGRVLVLCPKKLENNWRVYLDAAGAASNPFPDDRFSYTLLAHTDLTRTSGKSGVVDFSDFNWGQFGLVVVDESHNFRNDSKDRTGKDGKIIRSRYNALLEAVQKDVKTKILMLSATPVNTSLLDLRSQIYLMTQKRDGFFAESLGVESVGRIVKKAQEQFKEWEDAPGKKDKAKLLSMLGGDFLHLLGGVTIARSRRQIQKFYEGFIREQGDFPKREKPQNEYPDTDAAGEFSYAQLEKDIKKAVFHIYRPSKYIASADTKKRLEEEKKKYNFNQKDREDFLAAMMRVNFIKRLESSACALTLTLERTLKKIEIQTANIDKYLQNQTDAPADDWEKEFDQIAEEDEDFVVNSRAVNPYHLRELNVREWRAKMEEDRAALQSALDKVSQILPERDGKLLALKEQIRQKAKAKNRKLIVFTAFADTADYLYRETKDLAGELGIRAAKVCGDETETQCGQNEFTAILNNFSPRARKCAAPDGEIDLLVATDCVSEGQNLQDCDAVLNYDIHWNPVRLIQRFGRIDRIGSQNPSVRMINFWPTRDINAYLKLEGRVHARMALADAAATGDENLLEAAETEVAFRDNQLMLMKDEVFDMDALDNSVSMSDLTMDYFISQLLRYLQQNKDALENAPPGICAVADRAAAGLRQPRPGAVFCFRQNNAPKNRMKNPAHPFYLVHVEKDKVRRGYMQAREILELFESLAAGKPDALLALCDAFNRDMDAEKGRKQYDNMARAALDSIRRQFDINAAETVGLGGGRSGMLPKITEQPDAQNLQLITWLVIRDKLQKPAESVLRHPPRKDPPPELIK